MHTLPPISFVTGNPGKFEEARAIIPTLRQVAIELPEIQSLDPHEVVRAKLACARAECMDALVVEDTSLSCDVLQGLPGTFIKWFLSTLGVAGLADMVHCLGGTRGAEAACVVGYLASDASLPVFFEGRMRGTIVVPRGDGGFGWDALFQPEGSDRTLGEYTLEEKNTVSIRAQAFQALRAHVLQSS